MGRSRIHKLIIIECENCHRKFSVSEHTRNSQRFCSSECRKLFTIKKNTKICMECKKPFVTDYKQQVFCSKECHINHTRKQNTHECDYCHKKFIEPHQEGKKHFFCCAEHYRLYREEHKKTYVCEQCHKKFHRISRNRDACRFCSRECSKQYIHEHKQIKIKTKKLLFLTCTICGKDFLSKHNRECCSKECAYKLQCIRQNQKRKDNFAGHIAICKNCKKEFTTHYKGRRNFCSDECADAFEKHLQHQRYRHRLKGTIVDDDITLLGLNNKYHGICQLCGEPVDWSDISQREDGTMIAGDNYPSMDHVIPLAKGGLTEWSNVILAHRRCNYLKNDTMPKIKSLFD